jgi:hypothetical protein
MEHYPTRSETRSLVQPNRTFLGGGFDSLAHVVFGGLSVSNPIGIPVFLSYELFLPHYQPEYSISEFIFGYFIVDTLF